MRYFSHEEQDRMLESFNRYDRARLYEKYKGLVEELTGSPLLFPVSEASQIQSSGYVCSVCGYTCENEAPEQCPVCGSKAQAFSKVD